jgi:hypothetical protein
MIGDTDPIPVACTLETGDIPGRFAEWQQFFRSSVVRTESLATSVRLLLDPSEATTLDVVSLAQREKQCCAFFEFTMVIEADQRWLSITVPPEAQETLTTFMAMLRSETEPLSPDRSRAS